MLEVQNDLISDLEGLKLGAPLTELFIDAVRIDMATDTTPPEGNMWHYPFLPATAKESPPEVEGGRRGGVVFP